MMQKKKKKKRDREEDSPEIDYSARKRANRRVGERESPITSLVSQMKSETTMKSERKLDVYNQNALLLNKLPSHI